MGLQVIIQKLLYRLNTKRGAAPSDSQPEGNIVLVRCTESTTDNIVLILTIPSQFHQVILGKFASVKIFFFPFHFILLLIFLCGLAEVSGYQREILALVQGIFHL